MICRDGGCRRASVYRRRALQPRPVRRNEVGTTDTAVSKKRQRYRYMNVTMRTRCVHTKRCLLSDRRFILPVDSLNQTTELLLGYVMFCYFTFNYVIYLFESLHFA